MSLLVTCTQCGYEGDMDDFKFVPNAHGHCPKCGTKYYITNNSDGFMIIATWDYIRSHSTTQTGGHPPRRGRGLNGANPIVNGEIKKRGD